MSGKKTIPGRALRVARGRSAALLVSAGILALTVAGAATAQHAGGPGSNTGPLMLAANNGTSFDPVAGQTVLFAGNSQYALRESNLSDSGGGAIHGCRTQTPPPDAASPGDKPCLRANNLSTGEAFQFQTTKGAVGGRIQVGGTDIRDVNPSGVPFQTNAAGRVANLNADKVDGLDAAQLKGQRGPAGPAGPRGPKGAKGDPGAAGPQGARGPSDAWVARVGTVQLEGMTKKLLTLDLPAGSFVIDAHLEAQNLDSANENNIACNISGGPLFTEITVTVDELGESSVTLGDTVTTAQPLSVELRCGGLPTARVDDVVMTAVQVANLHDQSP